MSDAHDAPSPPPSPDVAPDAIESALDDLWSAINQLTRIKSPRSRYRVSVFGSARIKPHEPLYEEVKDLAAKLAAQGCDIVTGGGPGLMQAANEGEKIGDPHNQTRSIGIRIELPFEQGANPFVEELYSHRTFFTRLHQFVRLSDAFVVVGGGIGTTLEMLLVWQLLQVRHLDDVPLILVGDMWAKLVEWGRTHMAGAATPLASAKDFDIPVCVETIDEAVAEIEKAKARFEARAGVSP
jgi:uncharacterized protein (TIGR00730 family)